jgi:hypothetical protein
VILRDEIEEEIRMFSRARLHAVRDLILEKLPGIGENALPFNERCL